MSFAAGQHIQALNMSCFINQSFPSIKYECKIQSKRCSLCGTLTEQRDIFWGSSHFVLLSAFFSEWHDAWGKTLNHTWEICQKLSFDMDYNGLTQWRVWCTADSFLHQSLRQIDFTKFRFRRFLGLKLLYQWHLNVVIKEGKCEEMKDLHFPEGQEKICCLADVLHCFVVLKHTWGSG